MKPRLDGLEVFALPLADVKARVDACQSKRDAAICHLPAVATTAFCMPGHLMVAEPEALAAEHLLGQAMLMACAIESICCPGSQAGSAGDTTFSGSFLGWWLVYNARAKCDWQSLTDSVL